MVILFSCRSRSANGGAAQPMSIWPVITDVSVPGRPPVAVGFALEPACLSRESRIRLEDEPGAENAMVLLSDASLRLRILLSDFTYQNSSCAPVICAEMARIGAPLEKAPTVPSRPFDIETGLLEEALLLGEFQERAVPEAALRDRDLQLVGRLGEAFGRDHAGGKSSRRGKNKQASSQHGFSPWQACGLDCRNRLLDPTGKTPSPARHSDTSTPLWHAS